MRFDLHGAGESDQWLTSGLAEMLLTGLARTEGLDVIGTDRLQVAVGQLGAKSLDVLERSRFGEIARHAGAGAMVLGSIFSLGEQYRIVGQKAKPLKKSSEEAVPANSPIGSRASAVIAGVATVNKPVTNTSQMYQSQKLGRPSSNIVGMIAATARPVDPAHASRDIRRAP